MSEKAQYAPLIKFVEERAPIWEDRMGIGHVAIEHAFLDSYYADAGGGDDFVVTATTEGRWNYMQAKVKWHLPSAVRHDMTEIEKILVHEYAHVLLMPEQALLDNRLAAVNANESMSENEFEATQDFYYERLEMATENVARSLWLAWGPAIKEEGR